MECKNVKLLSYKDMKLYTDNFCDDNFIGKFQYGKIYRGHNGTQEVTVKKWARPCEYNCKEYMQLIFNQEIRLLQHSKMRYHPNVVKLIGYCCESEERLCVVYDLNPLDSLHNHVLKDNFTWQQRIKVIMGLACLLDSIRAKDPPNLPYLVRNIDAQHIMLDQDCNPKLCDFSIISGGIFPDWRSPFITGACGYIGLLYIPRDVWAEYGDIFAFGTLLIMLISKRVYDEADCEDFDVEPVHCWAYNAYNPMRSANGFVPSKHSLVHRSLQQQPGFYNRDGLKIAKLAMRCIGYWPDDLPTMKEVVRSLFNLLVVRRYADILDIHQMRCTKSAR
ncbi:hypothetical protein LguiB_002354 [Lonicera macranthoides]